MRSSPHTDGGQLIAEVRNAIRARHYSRRTEKAYVGWVRRFVRHHGNRHPLDLGEPEVTAFLSDLAVTRKVAASTQNQALSALVFLCPRLQGHGRGLYPQLPPGLGQAVQQMIGQPGRVGVAFDHFSA